MTDDDTPASEPLKEVDDACVESFKNLPSEPTPSEDIERRVATLEKHMVTVMAALIGMGVDVR